MQSSQPKVSVGKSIGLVVEDSNPQKPSIFLAGVQAFESNNQVCLQWYRNSRAGLYMMEVDGSQWLELIETLVTIKVAMAKGCSHAHRL